LTDYAVPSYTPTLGAVLNARRAHRPIRKSHAKVLLASVPNPFKWRPLPFAEQEVSEVEAVLPRCAVLRTADYPEGTGATVAGIRERLPEASVVHPACHGHQDPGQPLDSGFVLRDAMLKVADIMTLRLPSVLLAFLSACETGEGGRAAAGPGGPSRVGDAVRGDHIRHWDDVVCVKQPSARLLALYASSFRSMGDLDDRTAFLMRSMRRCSVFGREACTRVGGHPTFTWECRTGSGCFLKHFLHFALPARHHEKSVRETGSGGRRTSVRPTFRCLDDRWRQ
jgi:hypothetical protein